MSDAWFDLIRYRLIIHKANEYLDATRACSPPGQSGSITAAPLTSSSLPCIPPIGRGWKCSPCLPTSLSEQTWMGALVHPSTRVIHILSS